MTDKEYLKMVKKDDKKYPIEYEGKWMFDPSPYGGYFCRYCGCFNYEGCHCSNIKKEV